MQTIYLHTATNNACSYLQKLEIINLICFFTQRLNKKDPEAYPNCLAVLGAIFNVDFNNMDVTQHCLHINSDHVRSFGLICDDLMWGTNDEIPKPEGFTSAAEIKNKIITYFTEEWSPL